MCSAVRFLLAALIFVGFSSFGGAFLPHTHATRCSADQPCYRQLSLVRMASSHQESTDNATPIEPADIRQFLNQCSIQSFLFLLTQTRDAHTIKWVDTFTRPLIGGGDSGNDYKKDNEPNAFVQTDKQLSSPLLHYHGLSAMNTTLFPTWDSYFKLLLQESPLEIVVETNNPLLKEFTVDIDPPRLCSRILSVRSQLAKEWENDLQVIANMGSQIFYSYWQRVEKERQEQQTRNTKDTNGTEQSGQVHANHESLSSSQNTTSGWTRAPPLTSQVQSAGFERSSLMFLEWDPDQDYECVPSPLRKGNFDLLLLLSTREAIRRVLLRGQEEADGSPCLTDSTQVAFLESFYKERQDYFTRGSSRYRRADDFLEQLMLSPPSIVVNSEETVLIDPLRLAELVVLEREQVCNEWADIARLAPEEHVEIQKLQLDRMMDM